jgi:hypothetical protein
MASKIPSEGQLPALAVEKCLVFHGTRARSTSQCPSTSATSTETIDSSQKITIVETLPLQDNWGLDTEIDLLDIEEFKEKTARAKHWKEFKNDLKAYVASVRSDAVSKKFEVEIKVIGRR